MFEPKSPRDPNPKGISWGPPSPRPFFSPDCGGRAEAGGLVDSVCHVELRVLIVVSPEVDLYYRSPTQQNA
jgi:hypothetical protein